MRVAAFNTNGMQDQNKRRELVESFKKGRIDVLGVGETHMRGQGSGEYGRGNECKIWEGMDGGVVWTGLDEGYKGRGKEGCAILLSPRVWKGKTEHGWNGSRIVWVKGKIGIVKYAWVCVYAPVNMKTTKGKEEMKKFWKNLNECLSEFESERKVIVMGDMNAKVGCEEIEGIVGKWGVPGMNENGEYLVDMCAERGLFLANTFFEHKMIHRYTWRRRDAEEEQKGLIDYIAVDERLKKDVMDAKVVRGLFQGSDHFAVLAEVRTKVRWVHETRDQEERKVLATERLNEEECKIEYERRLTEVLNEVVTSGGMLSDVNCVFEMFRDKMIETVGRVVGYRVVRRKRKNGSAWWTSEVKGAVEEKKKAYDRLIEKNVPVEVKRKRKQEYKLCKRKVKQVIKESKEKVDDEFGRKLSEKFNENKKLYWKEVKKERGGCKSGSDKVKDKEGNVLSEREAVKGRWKEYFEGLMNVENKKEAVVTCMGMEKGGARLNVQGPVSRREVKRAIGRLKMGKAPGVDGITAEMLRFGGEVVIDWMHLICNLAWKQGTVPKDWVKAIMVPIYKGKGSKDECGSYRGISLLSIPGKVYGKVIIERVMEITESRISEEQGGFRKGRGCVDQIFSVKMTVEKYLAKDRKLYAAFMDLEKAYDRVDWNALWDVLKIYGVGGQLLNGIKAFYKEASACVRVNGEMSESFDIRVGVRQGCVMSPWLFNIFMDSVIREMKAKVGKVGARMNVEGERWWLVTSLFADDSVLMAESESELQKIVDEFNMVCKRRKLKVNEGKSKVMVFERRKSDVIDFARPYRVSEQCVMECKIDMDGVRLEEVKEFKYLGTMLCKYGSMEGEIRERAVQGRRVIGSLGRIMKGRSVSMEVKKGLRDSIVIPTLTYASETWTWNEAQRSRVRAVEMSYLRGACGTTRWEGETNERVYERFGMSEKAKGMDCGVVEWVKRSTLRWFGHVERMQGSEFTKRVYESEIDGIGVRGRPPVRWENRVEEYMRERNQGRMQGLGYARHACMDRSNWRLFCRGHPLGGSSRRERGVRAIDR